MYDILLLAQDLEIDVSDIRFHAVHRIGKTKQNKPRRPIIASFVCCEDKGIQRLQT